MVDRKHLIKPDLRSRSTTPEWLESQLSEVPLSSEVPENVRDLVELALDVARYGYFRYEFYHLAFTLLLFSFEAALREKLGHEKWSLQRLVEKAKKCNLIPGEFSEVKLKAMRSLRNIGAHPKIRTITPPNVRAYLTTIHLINCIFDGDARETLPPVLARDRAEREKYRLMAEAIMRIDSSKLKPGDVIAVVGVEEPRAPGAYECFECGRPLVVSHGKSRLNPCLKCGGLDFRFVSHEASSRHD